MDENDGPRRRRPPAADKQSKKQARASFWGRRRSTLGRLFSRSTGWLNQPLGSFASPETNPGRTWQALTKHRSLAPRYVRQSWAEVRCVTWPQFPQALRLTWAVVVFAVIFSILVATVDWILTEIFKEVIINKAINIRLFLDGLF